MIKAKALEYRKIQVVFWNLDPDAELLNQELSCLVQCLELHVDLKSILSILTLVQSLAANTHRFG